MRLARLLVAPIAIAGAGAFAATPGPPPGLEPCAEPAGVRDARCGVLPVPENRARRDGRTIPLRVLVLPARASDPEPDPVFILAGGPGQAASDLVSGTRVSHARILERRDVVFVDQRGTGASNPLRCLTGVPGSVEPWLGAAPRPREIRRCRQRLAARADLARYTTPVAADDLDAVRSALRYERINLDGGSYGTRVALVYMRRHPERVRSAVLRGVLPTGAHPPLVFPRAAQRALDAVFDACDADVECAAAYPALRRRFGELLERFERGPVTVELPRRGLQPPRELALTGEAFVTQLHLMLYPTTLLGRIPYLLDQCHRGNYDPFVELALELGRSILDQIHDGVQFTVMCTEDLPGLRAREIRRAAAGTFLAAARLERWKRYCRGWPRAPLPDDYHEPVRSAAPTLVISGARDPSTPPELAAAVVRQLAGARHVVLDHAAHITHAECLDELVARFIERGVAEGLDAGCAETIGAPRFLLPSAADPPHRGERR